MTTSARFRAAYAEHRAAEGRSADPAELLALPYPDRGPWLRQWQVRARTWERLLRKVVAPLAKERARPLEVLDLGAGNGWLCYQLARRGHHCVALDWRKDAVDGLGASAIYAGYLPAMFGRVAASFQATALRDHSFDLAVFNAAIHYTDDLAGTLAEAARITRTGGRIAVLDSPFYPRDADGARMVSEKHDHMTRTLGDRAADLLSHPAIEYLTPERLARASSAPGLRWRRHRVWYPLWYEARGLAALVRGGRTPSRFDLWETTVP